MKYSDKLKDPRWQKKRLQILERDEWTCQRCMDSERTLHVHHRRYFQGKDPWDYENKNLLTLCETCHEEEKILRPDNESDLLDILKENFLSDDLHEISSGFLNLELIHISSVVASAIRWSLENTEIHREIIDRYLKTLTD